ncbi:hypothetical protein Taro_015608 [Colocasia esculenta]|uniref:CCT domain-containing protein n=1 Tax=Colocasia esculenta TaxID=4460 RepID=A0A843UI97_COLES|nr:hypothetical protein [Colocasia esculenta]
MYAETGLLLPYLQDFPPEFHQQQHPLQEELLCRLQSSHGPLLLHGNAGSNMMQTTTITDYDLGGEGDLFKAPEAIIEEPEIELDPMTAAISMMSNCDDITAEVIKIADIDSIPSEQLLSEVFYECEKDLLAKSAVDAFSEFSDDKSPLPQSEEDKIMENSEIQDKQQEISASSSCPTSLEDACSELSDVKIPALQIEEKITRSDEAVRDETLQKSVSAGCLASLDWINGGYMKPSFLDFKRVDLSAVFSMRRAYSEGDIQTLGDGNLGHVNANVIHPSFERLLTIDDYKAEARRQKLSRYRKKKTKRNFGRKIKYACRKALADSQPRVRGRFAKSIEDCEIPKGSK